MDRLIIAEWDYHGVYGDKTPMTHVVVLNGNSSGFKHSLSLPRSKVVHCINSEIKVLEDYGNVIGDQINGVLYQAYTNLIKPVPIDINRLVNPVMNYWISPTGDLYNTVSGFNDFDVARSLIGDRANFNKLHPSPTEMMEVVRTLKLGGWLYVDEKGVVFSKVSATSDQLATVMMLSLQICHSGHDQHGIYVWNLEDFVSSVLGG